MAHIPKATTDKAVKAGLAAKSADGRRPWPANHHAIRPSNNRNGSNIGRQLKKAKKHGAILCCFLPLMYLCKPIRIDTTRR